MQLGIPGSDRKTLIFCQMISFFEHLSPNFLIRKRESKYIIPRIDKFGFVYIAYKVGPVTSYKWVVITPKSRVKEPQFTLVIFDHFVGAVYVIPFITIGSHLLVDGIIPKSGHEKPLVVWSNFFVQIAPSCQKFGKTAFNNNF